MKIGLLDLLKQEPTDLHVIYKSMRLVSIETTENQVLSILIQCRLTSLMEKQRKSKCSYLRLIRMGSYETTKVVQKNKYGQLIDVHGVAIPEATVVVVNAGVERQRALRDYNSPEEPIVLHRSTIC